LKVIGNHILQREIGLKTIISIFIMALSISNTFANDIVIVEPSTDVLDQFLDEDISFQNLDSLSDVLNIDNQKYKKYKPKEFIRQSPTTPKKLYAVLKKESHLHSLESEKVISNPEKIYVNAREVYYGGKWSYIYNKDNKEKYKTLTKNLVFIEEVIKLRPTIPGNETYPMQSKYNIVDSNIPFEFHILYRNESTNYSSFNILTNDSLETAASNSLSLKGYFNSLLPIDIGFVFDFQTGKAEGESDSVTWKSFSIGPTIKYDFYKTGNFTFNTQFAVKKSLFFSATSSESEANFSSLSWQAGLESVYHTKYGNISLGFDRSFIRTSTKGELPGQSSFSNEKETMAQNAFTIGYQYTWML